MAVRAGEGQALGQPSTHFKNKPSLAKFLKRLPCKTLDETKQENAALQIIYEERINE
jgi:hypothetical protein